MCLVVQSKDACWHQMVKWSFWISSSIPLHIPPNKTYRLLRSQSYVMGKWHRDSARIMIAPCSDLLLSSAKFINRWAHSIHFNFHQSANFLLLRTASTAVSCNLIKHAMCICLYIGQTYSVRGQMPAAPVWYSRLFTLKHHTPSRESNQH